MLNESQQERNEECANVPTVHHLLSLSTSDEWVKRFPMVFTPTATSVATGAEMWLALIGLKTNQEKRKKRKKQSISKSSFHRWLSAMECHSLSSVFLLIPFESWELYAEWHSLLLHSAGSFVIHLTSTVVLLSCQSVSAQLTTHDGRN